MKAQTELVGLAFIMAIVIVAGVVAISLSSKQSATESQKTLAEHTLHAILHTTITCNGEQMELSDAVRECGKNCDCMKQETKKLLAFTFEKENLDYEYTVTKIMDEKTASCGKATVSAGVMIIPGTTENTEAVLKICKKAR